MRALTELQMKSRRTRIRLATTLLVALFATPLGVRAGAPEGHFVDNGDDTVTDTATGLMWQKTVELDARDRASASGYCQELELGDHDDWRLATVLELSSIVDENSSFEVTGNGALDKAVFPQGAAVAFWSSTSAAGNQNASWVVEFSAGYSGTRSSVTKCRVRCVRDAN
jgi:hypothetical protein